MWTGAGLPVLAIVEDRRRTENLATDRKSLIASLRRGCTHRESMLVAVVERWVQQRIAAPDVQVIQQE
jgi:hypothetical protein